MLTRNTQVRSFGSLNTSKPLKWTPLHSNPSSQILWKPKYLQTTQMNFLTLKRLKTCPLEIWTPPKHSNELSSTQNPQVRSVKRVPTSKPLKSTSPHSNHSSQILWRSKHLQTSQINFSTLKPLKSDPYKVQTPQKLSNCWKWSIRLLVVIDM